MSALGLYRRTHYHHPRRPSAVLVLICCVVLLVTLFISTTSTSTCSAATIIGPRQRFRYQSHQQPTPQQVSAGTQESDPSSVNHPQTHHIRPVQEDSPPSGDGAFPSYARYAALVDKASDLPELVYIPFEEAVAEDTLQGWEAEWLLTGRYDAKKWGFLEEPRMDFVYTWVNGSEPAFQTTKRPYELNSTLNDPEGRWRASHGENRYRDWNELKYSVRSVEAYAPFENKIQVLVNSLQHPDGSVTKQVPSWLDSTKTGDVFEVLATEEFFEADKRGCLPTFNSLTIENQLHNTPSETDRMFALSDDMLLGRPHAASDMYSPLFGPLLGFKSHSYSTARAPNREDAHRFGEKPWLIYTSWLLNRRFGNRKRKGQAHFGHSISRKIHRETMQSFPGPDLQSACSRFRGDFGFQLYSWYANFHYTIERHREALLWSYLMHRSDPDRDGYLSWDEREQVIKDLQEGLSNEGKSTYRSRTYYHLPEILEAAGLEPPKVNLDITWTSMDGPIMTQNADLDCYSFDVNACLAPGFAAGDTSAPTRNPSFSTAAIFDRVMRQDPKCGDCLIKILLHRAREGLGPMMPHNATQPREFETVVKALMRYQYVVHEPDGLFVMVTDAEQVEATLVKRLLTKGEHVGQLCLNDDVNTQDEREIQKLHSTMNALFEGLLPEPSRFEKE